MQPDFIARLSNTPQNIMMNGVDTFNRPSADVGQFDQIYQQSLNKNTQSSSQISYATPIKSAAEAQSRLSNIVSTSVQVTGVIDSNTVASTSLRNLVESIADKLNLYSSHLFAQGKESALSENMHLQQLKNKSLSDLAKKHHGNIGKLFHIIQNTDWESLPETTKKELYKTTDDLSKLQVDLLTEIDQLKKNSPQQVQLAILQMEKDWTNLAMDTFRLIQMADGDEDGQDSGNTDTGNSDYLYDSFIQQSSVLMNSTTQLINQNITNTSYLTGAVNGQDALLNAQAQEMYQQYQNPTGYGSNTTGNRSDDQELDALYRFRNSF